MFCNAFRFTGDLVAKKDNNLFENSYREICPPKFLMKNENIEIEERL